MAWIYFQELVGFRSHSEDGYDPLRIVKSTDIARACYCIRCDKVTLASLPSGTMCELSDQYCSRKSTSFTAASRARTSVLRELAKVWVVSDRVYSLRSSALSKKQIQLSSSLKTSLRSGQEELLVFVSSWPASGMISGGQLFQPKALEPNTSETDGSSLLPTPTASDYGSCVGGAAGRSGKARPSLGTMARKNLWPTPKASEASRGDCPGERRRRSPCLTTEVNISQGTRNGQLNPMWVEWLMGFPLGWTELSPLEMAWFRSKSAKPSKNSRASSKTKKVRHASD